MKERLLKHFKMYPEMQIQDAVKLIFQSEFGPGHLIENPERAKNWLIQELKETENDEPQCIEISDELVRLHLGKMKECHAEMILGAMIQTADGMKGSMENFLQKCTVLKESGYFPERELEDYLCEYLKGDSLVVSHTQVYRNLYHPHYRVLKKELAESIMAAVEGKENYETESKD